MGFLKILKALVQFVDDCAFGDLKNFRIKVEEKSKGALQSRPVLYGTLEREQTGTGPSRRHIQGSKIARGLPIVNLQNSKIEKAKNMNRVARRGPLARAPGALKGGHF